MGSVRQRMGADAVREWLDYIFLVQKRADNR